MGGAPLEPTLAEGGPEHGTGGQPYDDGRPVCEQTPGDEHHRTCANLAPSKARRALAKSVSDKSCKPGCPSHCHKPFDDRARGNASRDCSCKQSEDDDAQKGREDDEALQERVSAAAASSLKPGRRSKWFLYPGGW